MYISMRRIGTHSVPQFGNNSMNQRHPTQRCSDEGINHMAIRLYNTTSRNTDELRPITPGLVRMYVCGVTVYDRAHIGHAMSAIVFDVLRRYPGVSVNSM
jgi:hypothetical protein